MTMATKLRSYRKARGWSQIYVAKEVGITARALRYIESGRKLPSLPTSNKLEDLFGVSNRELLVPDFTPDLSETKEKVLENSTV